MCKFVKLHEGKEEVFVNLDCVSKILVDNGTKLFFCSQHSSYITVSETPQQILELV